MRSSLEHPSKASTPMACASVRGAPVAAFGTGKNVVIACGQELSVNQVLGPLPEAVEAVALSATTLALAVAYGGSVVEVYTLDTRSEETTTTRLSWSRSCALDARASATADLTVRALAWLPGSGGSAPALLTVGTSLVLWQRSADVDDARDGAAPSAFVAAKTVALPAEATRIECSPDGRLAVTCGSEDKLPRCWHDSTAEWQGATEARIWARPDFVYMPHFAPVTAFAFRELPCATGGGGGGGGGGSDESHRRVTAARLLAEAAPGGAALSIGGGAALPWALIGMGSRPPRNVLLTVARDHVLRLWSETQLGERFELCVCLVLDAPVGGPGGAGEGAGGAGGAAWAWLHGAAHAPAPDEHQLLLPAGGAADAAGANGSSAGGGGRGGRGGQTMVVRLEAGGRVSAYRVEGLDATLRRTPTCELAWEARPAAAAESAAGGAHPSPSWPAPSADASTPVQAAALVSSVGERGEVEVAVLARSRTGVLTCDTVELPRATAASAARAQPRSSLGSMRRARLGAHDASARVLALRPHPTLPLLLSHGTDGLALVWQCACGGAKPGSAPQPPSANTCAVSPLQPVALLPRPVDAMAWASAAPHSVALHCAAGDVLSAWASHVHPLDFSVVATLRLPPAPASASGGGGAAGAPPPRSWRRLAELARADQVPSATAAAGGGGGGGGGEGSGAPPRVAVGLCAERTLVAWAVCARSEPARAADDTTGGGGAAAAAAAAPLAELRVLLECPLGEGPWMVDCAPARAGAPEPPRSRAEAGAPRAAPRPRYELLISLDSEGAIGLWSLLARADGGTWGVCALATRSAAPAVTRALGGARALALSDAPGVRIALCGDAAALELLELHSAVARPSREALLRLSERPPPLAARPSAAVLPTVLASHSPARGRGGSSASGSGGGAARASASAAGAEAAGPACAAWFVAWGGQRVLAAASGRVVRVCVQPPTHAYVRCGAPWAAVCRIDVRDPVSAVAWLADGSLVVCAAGGLRVCAGVAPRALCAYDASARRGGLLVPSPAHTTPPPHHPRVLIEDMLGGRLWRVERVVAHLKEALERAHQLEDAADAAAAAERAAAAASAADQSDSAPAARRRAEPAEAVLDELPLGELLLEGGSGGADEPGAASAAAASAEAEAAAEQAASDRAEREREAAAAAAAQAAAVSDLFAPDPIAASSVITLPSAAEPPAEPRAGVAEATSEDADDTALHAALERVPLAGLGRPAQRQLLGTVQTYSALSRHQALDAPGLRFLARVRLATDARHRRGAAAAAAASHGELLVHMSDVVWAVHSECHEALLDLCLPAGAGGGGSGGVQHTWAALTSVGAGYWLCRSGALRAAVERVAKAQFSARKEPDDAALFYLALGRKGTLLTLYKAAKNAKLVAFLSNDFETDRWRTAALKNAYALVSKRNWPLAVAFFLLGGKWRDASAVAARHMADVQLALVLAALAPEEPLAEVRHVLSEHALGGRSDVLGRAPGGGGGGGGSGGAAESARVWLACVAHLLLSAPAAAHAELVRSCAHPPRALLECAATPQPPASAESLFSPSVAEYLAWLQGQKLLGVGRRAVPRQVHGACVYAYLRAECALLALSAALELAEPHTADAGGDAARPRGGADDADSAEEEEAEAEGRAAAAGKAGAPAGAPGAASEDGAAAISDEPQERDEAAQSVSTHTGSWAALLSPHVGAALCSARARTAVDAATEALYGLLRSRLALAARQRAGVVEASSAAAPDTLGAHGGALLAGLAASDLETARQQPTPLLSLSARAIEVLARCERACAFGDLHAAVALRWVVSDAAGSARAVRAAAHRILARLAPLVTGGALDEEEGWCDANDRSGARVHAPSELAALAAELSSSASLLQALGVAVTSRSRSGSVALAAAADDDAAAERERAASDADGSSGRAAAAADADADAAGAGARSRSSSAAAPRRSLGARRHALPPSPAQLDAVAADVVAAVAVAALASAWYVRAPREIVKLCRATGLPGLRATAHAVLHETSERAERVAAGEVEADAEEEAAPGTRLGARECLALMRASARALAHNVAHACAPPPPRGGAEASEAAAEAATVTAHALLALRAWQRSAAAAERALALSSAAAGRAEDALSPPTRGAWAAAWTVLAPVAEPALGTPAARGGARPPVRAAADGSAAGARGGASSELVRARGEVLRAMCVHPSEPSLAVAAPARGLLLLDSAAGGYVRAPGSAAAPPPQAEASAHAYSCLAPHPTEPVFAALTDSAVHAYRIEWVSTRDLGRLVPPQADGGGGRESPLGRAAAAVGAGAAPPQAPARAMLTQLCALTPPPLVGGGSGGGGGGGGASGSSAAPQLVRAAFDPRGVRLAVGDAGGRVSVWAWQGGAAPGSAPPYYTLSGALPRRVADLAWLESTTLVACCQAHGSPAAAAAAAAGGSAGGATAAGGPSGAHAASAAAAGNGAGAHGSWSACLVDVLLPPGRAIVGGVHLADGVGTCLLPLRDRLQVLLGGRRGELVLWDLRTHRIVHTWSAHAGSAVRALASVRGGALAASGASDGSLKLWDVHAPPPAPADASSPALVERWSSAKQHERHTILQPLLGVGPGSAHGITALTTTPAAEGSLYSCGADGRALVLPLPAELLDG